jgi:hypothetical protein
MHRDVRLKYLIVDDLITNPPRRGGPLCPPVRFGMEMGFIDVNPPLAGWMHRMCADLAGWDENSVWFSVRLGWFHALSGPVGRPSPMVTTGCFETICWL